MNLPDDYQTKSDISRELQEGAGEWAKHAESVARRNVVTPADYKMDNQAPPPGYTGEPRVGGWISTYIGIPFWPCDPRPEEIDIRDIAHALSNQCRFAGHVDRFYSVAEHSFRVAFLLGRQFASMPRTKRRMMFWGLMHDAPEAYLVDLPRPLKHTPGLGEHYQGVEANLMRVIAERFGLHSYADGEPGVVKDADLVLLESERIELLPGALWAMDTEPLPETERKGFGWSPARAEIEFLSMFEVLYNRRDTQ